jgi:hypothetical protein
MARQRSDSSVGLLIDVITKSSYRLGSLRWPLVQ